MLRYVFDLFRSNVVDYDPENYVQDTKHFPQFMEELQKVKSTMSSNSQSLFGNGKYLFIVL